MDALPSTKINYLLTALGRKPAARVYIRMPATMDTKTGEPQQIIPEEPLSVAHAAGLHVTAGRLRTVHRANEEPATILELFVGSSAENVNHLKDAVRQNDVRAVGLASGHPETAVEALASGQATIPPSQVPGLKRGIAALANFPFSEEHQAEEIQQVQAWADAVKAASPKIYAQYLAYLYGEGRGSNAREVGERPDPDPTGRLKFPSPGDAQKVRMIDVPRLMTEGDGTFTNVEDMFIDFNANMGRPELRFINPGDSPVDQALAHPEYIAVAHGFDLQSAINNATAQGLAIEVGGPTQNGFYMVDNVATVPTKVYASNINPDHATPSQGIDYIADLTHLPHSDSSIGIMFASSIGGPRGNSVELRKQMFAEGARTLKPGGLFVAQRIPLEELENLNLEEMGFEVTVASVTHARKYLDGSQPASIVMSFILQKKAPPNE